MSKIEQFINSLIVMTKKNFVNWKPTSDYIVEKENKSLSRFVNENINGLGLDPRISYTGEFYGNIVSIFNIKDDYQVYLQTSREADVKPINLKDFDMDNYNNLLNNLLSSIKNKIIV